MPAPEVEPASLPVLDVMPPALSFLQGVTNEAWARWMYHSEVSYSDALLDRVRKVLADSGDWEHTGVLVTADHGEALGEHDTWYTHVGLYPEVIRVPLILRLPGQPARGRVETPVSTVDIAATLLSYAGVRAPEPMRGLDLLRLDEGAPVERRLWFQHSDDLQIGCMDERYWFITTPSSNMRFGLEIVVDEQGLRRSEIPVIPEGTSFLYDWRADPGFERDLAAERPELVERYIDALERWRETAQPVGSQERAMGDAERAHLADIGYGGQGD